MTDEDLFNNCDKFIDINGNECYLITPIASYPPPIWKKVGEGKFALGRLNYKHITKELLIKHDVWSNFTDSIQCKIEGMNKEKEVEVKEKMAKARSKRRKKYDDLPKELVCECGNKVTANWSYLNKKADKLGIPAMDLAKNYKCQVCNPTKGRGKKK
jgi:hypothetical protein